MKAKLLFAILILIISATGIFAWTSKKIIEINFLKDGTELTVDFDGTLSDVILKEEHPKYLNKRFKAFAVYKKTEKTPYEHIIQDQENGNIYTDCIINGEYIEEKRLFFCPGAFSFYEGMVSEWTVYNSKTDWTLYRINILEKTDITANGKTMTVYPVKICPRWTPEKIYRTDHTIYYWSPDLGFYVKKEYKKE